MPPPKKQRCPATPRALSLRLRRHGKIPRDTGRGHLPFPGRRDAGRRKPVRRGTPSSRTTHRTTAGRRLGATAHIASTTYRSTATLRRARTGYGSGGGSFGLRVVLRHATQVLRSRAIYGGFPRPPPSTVVSPPGSRALASRSPLLLLLLRGGLRRTQAAQASSFSISASRRGLRPPPPAALACSPGLTDCASGGLPPPLGRTAVRACVAAAAGRRGGRAA